MPVIYIDECGHTGEDLTRPDEPVFVVASHNIDEEEARSWKARFFGRVAATELKHSQLQRRQSHHDAIIAFLSEVLERNRVRAAAAHKRFALVGKLIDWLIEPVLHQGGLDLYERDGLGTLSTVVYFSLLVQGEARLKRVLDTFQRAARTRDPNHISECNDVLLSPEIQSALQEIGQFFSVSIASLGVDWISRLPPRALSLSVALVMNVCFTWRQRGLVSFDIVHDRSAALAIDRNDWEAILSKEAPPALVGKAGFELQFPIGVDSVRFEDSREFAALQLADILAGALARWMAWMSKEKPPGDRYAERLHEVLLPRVGDALDVPWWPVPEIEPASSTPAGRQDPLDYMTSVLASNRRP